MFDLDKWQEILTTLTRNWVRSLFTGFGVFWGILMLIILLGLGNSFEGGIMKSLDGFATNSCFFWTNPTSEAYKGYRKGRNWTMKMHDIDLIRQQATALEYISPMSFGVKTAKNVVIGQKSGSYDVKGVFPEQFEIDQQHVLKGRLLNELDMKYNRKSCLIGKQVYETLFNENQDPIGQYLRVNGIYFQIVGVVKSKSQAQMGSNSETTVVIPFTTMQQAFNIGEDIYFIACTAKNGYSCALLEEQITAILKKNHDISPNDQKAIRSFNIEKQFEIMNLLFLGVEVLIWIVGIGSLLSGIIGVMNIMLVTVKERTREIGVRRALGAKPRAILNQIMSESLVLTCISGFLGLFVGVLILEMIRYFLVKMPSEDSFFIPPFISLNKAIAALLIISVSGLLAGLLPASRALQIKAIDAIRDE